MSIQFVLGGDEMLVCTSLYLHTEPPSTNQCCKKKTEEKRKSKKAKKLKRKKEILYFIKFPFVIIVFAALGPEEGFKKHY